MGEECLAENHPLKNDLILDHIFGYLDTGGNVSYKTLLTLREVCRQWKDHLTPRIMNRSKIVTFTSGPQGYRIWETKNQKRLDSLMSQAKTTSLEIIRPQYQPLVNKILKKNQLWNSTNWIQSNGTKFTRLTISGEFHEDVLTSLLQEWIPNLEELKMCTVGFSKDSNVVEGNLPSDFKPLEKLKHLTIEFGADRFLLENNIGLHDVAESALKVLAQAKNLQSLTLNSKTGNGNFPLRFFTKILSQDEEMLNQLTKLDLMTLFKIGKPVPRLLAELELTNLKELHIFIHKDGSLIPLLEAHGQKLEKLFVQVKNWWFARNEVFNIPELSKLEQLECTLNSRCCMWYNANRGMIFTAERIISSMPRLKSWKIQDDRTCVSSQLCAMGKCFHVQKLFETSDEQPLPIHTSLEKLDLYCSFQKPEVVLVMANAFVNIQILTIWINSGLLYPFFTSLSALEKLKHLIIQLNKPLLDLPFTVEESNMANFKCLKELTFEKVPMERYRTPTIYHVGNIHKAHSGFANFDSLRILSFSNLKIDPNQLELLREELLKSKPKLVVNYHYDNNLE